MERYVSQKSSGMNQCPRQLNLAGKMENRYSKVEIPRSLTLKLEPITSIDLHIFGDASM